MAKLTYKKRKRMKQGSFALEKEKKYPINDISHARNALARVSAHGNAKEKYEVRREVFARYPSLKSGKSYDLFQQQKKRRK